MPRREPLLWAVQVERESLMGHVTRIGFPWSWLHKAQRLMSEINHNPQTPIFVYGPFWTKEDAQRFLRRYHHAIIGQTVFHRSPNPLRRVCAWCKKELGVKEGGEGVTHGICPECRAGLKVPKRKT